MKGYKTMKRLNKWLINNGYTFEPVQYGDGSYFYNAPNYTYTAVKICISGNTINDIKTSENKLKKHIKNRYDIITESHYLYNYVSNEYNFFITIRTLTDKQEAENYYIYKDASIEFFEIAQHVYMQMGIYESHKEEFNKLIRDKMDYYGSLYNQSLIRAVTA